MCCSLEECAACFDAEVGKQGEHGRLGRGWGADRAMGGWAVQTLKGPNTPCLAYHRSSGLQHRSIPVLLSKWATGFAVVGGQA